MKNRIDIQPPVAVSLPFKRGQATTNVQIVKHDEDVLWVGGTIETIEPELTGNTEETGILFHYSKKAYYVRRGMRLPKDKVFHATWEGMFCGRQHGDKEHLLLVWSGTDNKFMVLEHCMSGGLLSAKRAYAGMNAADARNHKVKVLTEQRRQLDNMFKCRCGNGILLLDEKQPRDTCFTCYKKGNNYKQS